MPAILQGNGGLGHTLDAIYRVEGYAGCRGLQVVQIFYGTPAQGDPDGLYAFTLAGKSYRGYVDGGRRSRNVLQDADREHFPGKPYYYSAEQLAQTPRYGFDQDAGRGTIPVYDRPMGMRLHDEGYFETAIVAVGQDDGPDSVVLAVRWGWIMGGMIYRPAPDTFSASYQPLTSATVSQAFRDILADNYPGYQFEEGQ